MIIIKLENLIPLEWREKLSSEFKKQYFIDLEETLNKEYANFTVYPQIDKIFNAISFVKPEDVKVVILGQDPYIKPMQAHGLSFSVQKGVKFPKSLNNIFNELNSDIGCEIPTSGSLEKWAKQGVLLLNTILTVRENETNSHQNIGWQVLTNKILEVILKNNKPKVFILWGSFAKKSIIDVYPNKDTLKTISKHKELVFNVTDNNNLLLFAPHPSPLSSYRGFFGSKPFSQANNFLIEHNSIPIDWGLLDGD